MIDIEKFEKQLKTFDALRDGDAIKTDTVARIRPQYADEWPVQLHPSVRNALITTGIPNPYQHQAEAIRKSLGGADVVLESPTASGKTLAFTAPMLDSLLRNKGSHALMIYPMKALAFDQWDQITTICKPLRIAANSYDGDTDKEHKDILRKKPTSILLTNPEYLNMSFLGWREQWGKFLSNLRYVVIDEMHEYRGFFGSHMALLLRRFFLYLNRIRACPQVFLSTATCANPKEHAENLTGRRDVEVVSARNVFRPQRHFIFVKPDDIPDYTDYKYREILRRRIVRAALTVLTEELQALVFCPTKRFLEEAFSNCQHKAEEYDLNPNRISAFHADMKPDDRWDIQEKIKSGDIRLVFATNALELGLDIGGLDGVILAGFPPSIMSAWQQIGRAGRGWDKDAFVLFYAMNDPIDRFFVGNLKAFLEKPFDELVVDPSNESLIEKHLDMLAVETDGKLHPSDRDILGAVFYDLYQKNPKKLPSDYRPHQKLAIRGGFGVSYDLKYGQETLGKISDLRRFREAYIGAVFTFRGQKYRVHSHEEHAVVLAEADPNLRTDPSFYTVLTSTDIFDSFAYGEIEVYYGALNLVMNFTGYKLADERRIGEVIDEGGDNNSLFHRNLHAFRIDFRSVHPGIGALEHMIRVGAMFVIPADRFDASTYSKAGILYYYENYPGGIGIAKKLFEVWQSVLKKGIEIAKDCSCQLGCQNCIAPAKSYKSSDAVIDKNQGIELATRLLEAKELG